MAAPLNIFVVAFILVVIGSLLVFISIIQGSRTRNGDKRIEGGGVLIIGPLPIVFGTSERVTRVLVILAIVLLLASVFSFLLLGGILK